MHQRDYSRQGFAIAEHRQCPLIGFLLGDHHIWKRMSRSRKGAFFI
jgi:hypothetical protein